MSYQYYISDFPIIHSKLNQLREDLGLWGVIGQSFQDEVYEKLAVHLVPDYSEGFLQYEAIPAFKANEAQGLAGLVKQLEETLFKYAEPGSYTVTDERDLSCVVTVED